MLLAIDSDTAKPTLAPPLSFSLMDKSSSVMNGGSRSEKNSVPYSFYSSTLLFYFWRFLLCRQMIHFNR